MEMGEVVTHASTGVPRRGFRATIVGKTASYKGEDGGDPQGTRMERMDTRGRGS